MISFINNMLGIKGKGYQPDPFDPNDKAFSSLGIKISTPSGIDLLTPAVAIKDQYSTSSCVGQSIASAVQIAYIQKNQVCPPLSALYVYYNARAEEEDFRDNGTKFRFAMKSVMKLGICEESQWPQSKSVAIRPDYKSYRLALAQRGLRGYYRIDSGDVDSIRKALASRHPVVAGWDISNSLGSVKDAVNKSHLGSSGGHAMCLVGYSGDKFKLLNSWGTGWGTGGFSWANEEFVSKARDIWAVQV